MDLDLAALSGVTQDSSAVEPGFLFAALKGVKGDGRDYIDDAIENGAIVILSDPSVHLPANSPARLITVDNPRLEFSHIVSAYYENQPEHVVAVTGTNGKSSVVYFIDQLWKALGKSSSFIGTLSGTMTTPDPVALHELLAEMHADGVDYIALEASSHGLDQYRLDGMHISVAAFTSFSQDHLDYHIDMDAYLAAKSRLFDEVLKEDGVAVLNADSAVYDKLKELCILRGIRVLSYGEKGEDICLSSRTLMETGQYIEIELLGDRYALDLPFVGRFQAMNVLCAMACVLAEMPETPLCRDTLIKAAQTLDGVPGRLQHVTDGTYHAYVDYAHTPDALENVLEALRPHVKGRLICVFGCGGDRDTAKRPLMGEAAARLSDIAFITDDNPRSEAPSAIREQIMVGAKGGKAQIYDVGGRKDAITQAVEMMNKEDVLLVAGKGHEQGQVVDGRVMPFDDVSEVMSSMRRVKGKLEL